MVVYRSVRIRFPSGLSSKTKDIQIDVHRRSARATALDREPDLDLAILDGPHNRLKFRSVLRRTVQSRTGTKLLAMRLECVLGLRKKAGCFGLCASFKSAGEPWTLFRPQIDVAGIARVCPKHCVYSIARIGASGSKAGNKTGECRFSKSRLNQSVEFRARIAVWLRSSRARLRDNPSRTQQGAGQPAAYRFGLHQTSSTT